MKGVANKMDTVKTRKQGNAVMVTLASKFEVPEGKTYYISKESDGTISLIPKIEDYFVNAKENEFIDKEDEQVRGFEVESRLLDE
ncbi:type II toxin-antitoxin system PemI/MazE family antitoxin [Enterococcus sp. AZ007]|uniref:type II toxin-antitoxin system PemI/MazE family antitoxin n=1 Tax=Enterococcus sp. AZ007 TaxID=2774839 RepID=UPI003F23AC29